MATAARQPAASPKLHPDGDCDAIAELQGASAAGMQVVFSNREGNPQRDPGPFYSISRLDQLMLSA